MNTLTVIHITGTMRWIVAKQFFFCGIKVPEGFHTDFASIPRIFWVAMPPSGPYLEAAVIHDYCYSHLTEYMTKKQADKLFLQGMKSLGVGRVRRTLMYTAVRLFGRGNW